MVICCLAGEEKGRGKDSKMVEEGELAFGVKR